MEISSSTDETNELNNAKQKVKEEKCLVKERLAKTKAEYKQVLKDKNREITTEIEHIKKHMEGQMCKEREATSKANEHQLQTILSKLRSLKEKQVKDTTNRKVEEKALLDNIKASIDPIIKSDFKSGNHIGIGAHLKGLQEEVNNYCLPTVNQK